MKLRQHIPFGLIVATGAIVFSLNFAFAQSFTFTTFDAPLAAPGQTIGYGFSGNQIVGNYTDGAGNTHGFIKSGTNYTILDDPAASIGTSPNGGTYPVGISGSTVVGYFFLNGPFSQAFIYDIPSGTYLTENDPTGSWGTGFYGVSGNLIVGFTAHPPSGTGDDGILYNTNTASFSSFDDPIGAGGESTDATGISGNILVGYYHDAASHYHGFSYDLQNSIYTTLDCPLGGSVTNTFAWGISSNAIIGYYADSANHYHGFLEIGGVYQTLDVPGATDTFAHGTDGNTIVGSFHDGTGFHGFIATPTFGINIALYPGVTINGVIGQTYGIQSTTNLVNTIVGWA